MINNSSNISNMTWGGFVNNKEFKLIKNGYIFEYDDNFGHINVDNELTGECEDCIDIGMGIVFPDEQSFEAKCNEWLKNKKIR